MHANVNFVFTITIALCWSLTMFQALHRALRIQIAPHDSLRMPLPALAHYPLLGALQFCGVAAWAQPGCIFYSGSHEAKLGVSWGLTRRLVAGSRVCVLVTLGPRSPFSCWLVAMAALSS